MQKKEIEDIYNIVRDVLRDWWVVLCVAVSAAFLAYIASAVTYKPEYTSATTFVVSAKGSSTGAFANQSKAERLTEVFQSVMDSQILKKKVAEGLGLNSFPGTVKIAVVPETNLLTVSVSSDSPEMSFRLLKSLLDNYSEVGEGVFGEVVLEVFEEPNYPSRPDNIFNARDIMKKAFLLGALVMIAVLTLLSYMKDTVKTEKDVTQKLDTEVFASLAHESQYRNLKARLKRQKKKILITEPSVSFGFEETIKKIRTKLLYKMAKENCKVILVTSTGRQEGKTTLAVNIALAMAQRSKKVLLIEGDLRRTVLERLLEVQIPEGKGMDEKAVREKNIEDLVFEMDGTSLQLLLNREA